MGRYATYKADTHLLDIYVGWTVSVMYGATSWWNNKYCYIFIKLFLAVFTASFPVQQRRIFWYLEELVRKHQTRLFIFLEQRASLTVTTLLSFFLFFSLFFSLCCKYTNALSQHSCLFLRSVERFQYPLLHRLQLKILVAVQEFSES